MSASRSRDASTPQPSGYMQSYLASSSDASNNESDRMYNNGEALRGEGTFSAPPPPGFNTDSHEERVRMANHAIWNDPNEPTNWSLDTRTTSFTNLAAMIGTGLAESMEDSTQDARRDGTLYGLSYARQTRHAASRLLGSSGLSPTAALLDLTFPVHSQKRVSDASQFLNSNGFSGIKKDSPTSLPPYSPSTETDPMADFRATVQHRSHPPPSGFFTAPDRPRWASRSWNLTWDGNRHLHNCTKNSSSSCRDKAHPSFRDRGRRILANYNANANHEYGNAISAVERRYLPAFSIGGGTGTLLVGCSLRRTKQGNLDSTSGTSSSIGYSLNMRSFWDIGDVSF